METQLHYRNKGFRILAALIASYYILFHGRSLDIIGELRNPVFYIAFTVSFAIALLLVTWVHFVTTSLDVRFDWRETSKTRTFRQLLFGVLVPLVFDFTLMSVYFYFMGTNIFKNGFLRYDFPIIVCFILLLNFYYAVHFLLATSKIQNQPYMFNSIDEDVPTGVSIVKIENTISSEERKDRIAELFPKIEIDIAITDYILFFYANDKNIYLVNCNEEEIIIDRNLSHLEEVLPAADFHRINRSVIVNGKIFEAYTNGEKRNTLVLKFLDEFEPLIKHYGEDRFTVTKNYVEVIISHFGAL
ncbi:LytTR family DNA-binding domain-containing protein [Flavobacterium dauae]|uniref:LytTR family DNA-binding domain-containing protein n=1 Tax=Flavobacterium dauae TaxID=1563479 RepID=UPI00101B4E8A|nr:LytTR family DNA-binding domain-containing protein [Flavobacterium dauae]WLD24344.1 LytTR family DNA-binding domain-containing protein [Flavobacterium dauae]